MDVAAYHFTKREKEVIELLMKGMSNKQMAAKLGVSEHTIEFHLKNIYRKLGVSSKPEAMSNLGKVVVIISEKPGESAVEQQANRDDNDGVTGGEGMPPTRNALHSTAGRNHWRQKVGKHINNFFLLGLLGLLLIVALIVIFPRQATFDRFERECEYPDEASVGQTMKRSNASGGKVHGQFGTIGEAPWNAKAGYVVYKDIKIPQTLSLFLRLNYSKNSPASTLIQVYLDDETAPRASIALKDQVDWDQFSWTEPIYLGKVKEGVHALKLYTQGQQYGTADLDQFSLTSEIP